MACSATAIAMVPLFERGREALRLYIDAVTFEDGDAHGLLIGTAKSIDVVTFDDFVAHTALCFRHVVRNGAPTHVLCEGGAICALLEKRVRKW